MLNYTRFSSKSDVWAFGVLCWEVFTCGDMPYGRAKNPEVVERVQRGQILQRPPACPFEVYKVRSDVTKRVSKSLNFTLLQAMRLCWTTNPDDRPTFRTLKEDLLAIGQSLQMD